MTTLFAVGVAIVATGALLVGAAGQNAAPPAAPDSPAFDSVSVKRNRSGETRIRFEMPPGSLTAINVPLRFVIRQAYRVPEARILGGPPWLDADRFDIVARAPADAGKTSDELRAMLRIALADRFGLRLHMEDREMPVYSLRVARSDGTLGANLRPSKADCTGQGPRMAAGRVTCGILVSQAPASASLRGGGTTIAEFVRLLGDFLDRPILNETALAGTFDLELQFAAVRSAMPGAVVPGGLDPAAGGNDVPAVFTAIQEQLGLKLEPQRGVAEVLVIDRVAEPSEN